MTSCPHVVRFSTTVGGSHRRTCSAQEASLGLLRKELPLQSRSLPPILRYRDNFLVLCSQPPEPGVLLVDLLEVQGLWHDHLRMGIKVPASPAVP